nr:50S ribosomal protein L24 [Desulfurella sp.]
MKTKLKKGDLVKVIAGKDKGKTGKIISFVPKNNRVIVEGIKIIKKHEKATQTSKGGIIEKEAPIDISNVMLVCPHCNKPTRIASKILDDGTKVRVCKKCNETI